MHGRMSYVDRGKVPDVLGTLQAVRNSRTMIPRKMLIVKPDCQYQNLPGNPTRRHFLCSYCIVPPR